MVLNLLIAKCFVSCKGTLYTAVFGSEHLLSVYIDTDNTLRDYLTTYCVYYSHSEQKHIKFESKSKEHFNNIILTASI